ncbi:MAG TPA: DUF4192 domain-containing protein [Mycobacteriales bacterium]|nr:DUF4192 domain-containing protein [Mycobacteriales bacterium]
MTTDAFPVLRLSGPADWLQALPYLFGFPPRQSLVVLCLGGSNGKRLTFHLRVDLPRPADRGALVDHLAEVLGRQSFEDLLVVICRDEPGPPDDDDRALWALLSERVSISGRAIDALVVRAHRYWSLVCTDARCCPVQGSAVPTVEDSARIPAELVLRGCQAHESRDDVVAELAPLPGPARVLLAQRCQAADDAVFAEDAEPSGWSPAWVEAAVRRWADLLDGPVSTAPIDPDLGAALVVPLTHLTLRDCVAGVCLLRRERARPVLRELVRRLPEEWVPAPATILGLLEWADGDGLRAGIALDRALEADAAYSFARLLAQKLQAGIRLPDDMVRAVTAMATPTVTAPAVRRSRRARQGGRSDNRR